MATADYIISNQSGASFRTDLNNTLAAIVSNNSNSSEPATKYAYQWWADTSAAVMKLRNSANDGWIELFQLDGTLTLEDGSASAPGLAFRDDLDTGIFSSAANNFDIATGGSVRLNVSSSGINVTGGVTASGTSTFNEDVTFAGANVNITFDKSVDTLSFGDDSKLEFGGGQDLIIQHDTSGTDVNTINSANCDLNILHGTETMISCKDDGQVELYHDGTEAITTGSVFNVIKAASTGNPAGLQIFNTNDGSNFSHAAIKLESKNGASTGHIFADHNNSNLRLGFNTTGATLEIYNDGDIRVQGLRFGSDTADANTLNDYEEGQYQPTPTGDTGQTDVSIYAGENTLNYTKIGNLVNISGRLRMQTVAYSGGLRITLPFTAEANTNTSNASMAAVATHGADFDSTAGTGSHMGMFLEVGGGTAFAYFIVTRDNSAWIGANNTIIKADTYLAFTYTYRAA